MTSEQPSQTVTTTTEPLSGWSRSRPAFVVGQWSQSPPHRFDPTQPYSVIRAEVAQFKGNFIVYRDHVGTSITGDFEDIAFEHEADALRRAIQLNRDHARRYDNMADLMERRLDTAERDETGGYPDVKIGDRVMLLGTVEQCNAVYHRDRVPGNLSTGVIGRGRPGRIGVVVDISSSATFSHRYMVEYDQEKPSSERCREYVDRMEITHAAAGERGIEIIPKTP